MAKFEKEIQELKDSPLFALTLGGKELAHSNFWEWLMNIEVNNEHPFVSAFVNDYDKTCTFDSVKREEGNRDLTVRYTKKDKKKAVIIENKIKSIPTKDQLEKYEENYIEDYIEKENKKTERFELKEGILTGLKETLDLSELKLWKYLEYDNIAKNIEKINGECNDNCKGFPWYEYINQYAKDIRNIHKIVNGYINGKSYISKAPTELEDVRLGDIYLKLCGSMYIKDVIQKEINKATNLDSGWGKPDVDLSFNNKKTTITCVYKQFEGKGEEKKEIGRIGVQLEGENLEFTQDQVHHKNIASQSRYIMT